MGRINLKSEKSFKRKCRTEVVHVNSLSDSHELRLCGTGKVVATGSLDEVSLLRRFYEYRSESVQLKIVFDYETA